jgi:hypothetical protein
MLGSHGHVADFRDELLGETMVLTTLFILAAAQATAQSVPAAANAPAPTAKIECRMVQEPGSRIPTRICRLEKEWELLAKDVQDDLKSSRNSRQGAAPYQ